MSWKRTLLASVLIFGIAFVFNAVWEVKQAALYVAPPRASLLAIFLFCLPAILLWISAAIYAAGFFVAYLLAPILSRLLASVVSTKYLDSNSVTV